MVCCYMDLSDIISWFIKDDKIHSWDNIVDIRSYHLLYILFTSWYQSDDDMISQVLDAIDSIKHEPSIEQKLILLYKGVEYLIEPKFDDDDNDDGLTLYLMDVLDENHELDEFDDLYITESIFSEANYEYVHENITLPDEDIQKEVVRFMDMLDYIKSEYKYELSDSILI